MQRQQTDGAAVALEVGDLGWEEKGKGSEGGERERDSRTRRRAAAAVAHLKIVNVVLRNGTQRGERASFRPACVW